MRLAGGSPVVYAAPTFAIGSQSIRCKGYLRVTNIECGQKHLRMNFAQEKPSISQFDHRKSGNTMGTEVENSACSSPMRPLFDWEPGAVPLMRKPLIYIYIYMWPHIPCYGADRAMVMYSSKKETTAHPGNTIVMHIIKSLLTMINHDLVILNHY